MYWNRNKMEFNIKVAKLDFTTENIRVKIDVAPEEILEQLNIKDGYLTMDGMVIGRKQLFKSIREGSTFYVQRIQDKGWHLWSLSSTSSQIYCFAYIQITENHRIDCLVANLNVI